jgi:two-component system chemotaxis response regulator CheY
MAVDRNMNALIVDDDTVMRAILRKVLAQLNFTNVHEASDGAMALAILRANDFGLIISDWDMAPMTGIELLRAVRTDPRLRHIPFVMVTAESKAENAATAKEAGVSSYIVKPFTSETFKRQLTNVLGLR